MGRATNLTSSIYVSGGIGAKHREIWVRAIPEKPDLKAMDDEELGLTLKACTRVRTNALNAMNKINKEGQSKGWHSHTSAQKRDIQSQLDQIQPFHKALTEEADRRETEVKPPKIQEDPATVRGTGGYPPPGALSVTRMMDLSPPAEPEKEIEDKVGEATAQVDCSLYAMLKDVPLQELLEFAKQGVEADNNVAASLRCADLESELVMHKEATEQLTADAAKLNASLKEEKEKHAKLREEYRTLQKDYRKLKNASKELQNMTKRLQSLT